MKMAIQDQSVQACSAEEIQRAYYTRTAARYDRMHTASEDDEHYAALSLIDLICAKYDLKTVLDVGAGSGRGVRFLSERGRVVRGIEPVPALIHAAHDHGVPKGSIIEGTGYQLPFRDGSFDAALECAVLHHVASPDRVVAEMMRVARRAVFLSDCNRFGQGRYGVRLLKLLLAKARLWNAARFIQTGGKMYAISEGDGLAYSYSVFDSYRPLAEWADTIWLLPTSTDPGRAKSWLHPLLTAPYVLMCALRSGPSF
jgi:ubiquinone/menaquinone biosynthesis C-methylase UbiE